MQIKITVDREKKNVLKIYYSFLMFICLNSYLQGFMGTTIIRTLELICFIYILILFNKIHGFQRLKFFPKRYVLLLFGILSLFIVVRGGWSANPKYFLLQTISKTGLFLYISPFIILGLPNRKYLSDILHVFYKGALLVIPLWLISYNNLVIANSSAGEGIGALLPFFAVFLLGFSNVFTNRQNTYIYIIVGIFFLLMLLNARRNVTFSLTLYALIAYFSYLFNNKKKNSFKNFIIFLLVVLFGLIVSINWYDLTHGIFKNMSNKADEDTRSRVEELFLADFAKSPIEDWIWGRGMDGGYFQEMRNLDTEEITTNRTAIETGYLHLILKGGILYILFFLVFLIMAVNMGFKKKRSYDIYMSCILLTYLIDMYTTTPFSSFSVRTIIYWFFVSVLITNNRSNKRRSNETNRIQ